MSYELMIDSIGATSARIPAGAPKVAGYTTGSGGIEWTAGDWARFKGAKIRIDQSNAPTINGDVKDVEPGASTIASAVAGARVKRAHGQHCTIYIEASMLRECQAAVNTAGLGAWVDYWVANWSLSQTEAAALLGGKIVAIQFASPSSNPHTLIPGTNITLAAANCDLSVTLDTWHPAPQTHKKKKRGRGKVHRKVKGSTAGAALSAAIYAILHAAHVHITPLEQTAIATVTGALGGYITPAKAKP